MKIKFLLILMMLVAYIATMSAQEQTEAPVVTCEFDEIGYATIIIAHDDPEAEIYYRICYCGPDFDDNWTDWMIYSGPFCFQEAGEYEVQAYAISPGKSASDSTLQHILVELSETEPPVFYCESVEHNGHVIIDIIHDDPWATIYFKIIVIEDPMYDFQSSEPEIPVEPDEWYQYSGPIDIHAELGISYVYVWAAAVSPGRPQSETVFSMFKVQRPFTTATPFVYAHHVDADKGLALRIVDGIALENDTSCLDMVDFYYYDEKTPAQYFHYKINDADEWTELTDEYLYLKEYGDYTLTTYASSDRGTDSGQDTAIVSYRPDSFGSRDGYRIVYDGVVYNLNNDDTTTVGIAEEYFDGLLFYYYPGIYPVKSTDVIPETFTIHDNDYTVTRIGCGALWNFTNVRIPKTITYISIGHSNDYGYMHEHDYMSISVDEENPVYDSRDNCNAVIETATNTLILGCSNTVIPSTVTAIGHHAFNGCGGMTSVTIGNSVTAIGECAFWHCYGLTRVTIGNPVTTIGEAAFMNCNNLTSIISKPTIAPAIGYNAFCGWETDVYEQATLFVPAESLEAYRAHEEWGKFTHIVPFLGAGPGDINGDGNIAISDATNLIDQLLSGDELPAYADVNGDGVVTIKDVTDLIDMLLSGN